MSSRAEELFDQFLEARAAGAQPDPADFIAEAGDEATALAGMLTAYLATHAHDDVSEAAMLELAASPELAMPRPWPELLPALRERRGILRKKLLLDVTDALNARQPGAAMQVDGYLHELETGRLDPRRVRPAVVDALAKALDAPRALLEAARWIEPQFLALGAVEAPAFARRAVAADSVALSIGGDQPTPDPRIDDLFTGGPDG